MLEFRTIRRIACALLILSAGLSAQRYTGHDHAVFHRPAPPPPAVKHQGPPTNGIKNPQKAAPATPQPASRTAAQNHPEVDLNHDPTRLKTGTPAENTPHL